MIKKLIRQMLAAQVLSALTVSLCLLIDNIMIGRFLGVDGITAYGLANPVLLLIGARGSMLSAGIQVTCSKSLGRGSQEETNAGYSSAIALTLLLSALLTALVLLLKGPLSTLLGAGREGELFTETRGYLTGFIVGAPASMGALVLVPFLQMAGQSGLLIVSVLTMTVADVGFDLLNVLVFDGGMFGIGLASSLSYYAALLVAMGYFLSKKCAFRFSIRQVTRRKIRELFTSGIPSVFAMASTVVQIFAVNQLLLGLKTAGEEAVAAYTVINTIGNAACCICTGVGGVTLTLAGILYNEEDRSGLKELMRRMCFWSLLLGVCAGGLLVLFSPQCAHLFIEQSDEGPLSALHMAITGLRVYALGLIPCCINYAFKNLYQATGRVRLTECISILEGALWPILCVWALTRIAGVNCAWSFFALGEALTLLCVLLNALLRRGKAGAKGGFMLLLKPDFGVTNENLMEADIRSLSDVTGVSAAAEKFCLNHGQDAHVANRIALCIEEMAANVIQHGFSQDQKPHHLMVRVLHKPDHFVLRFRDDCRAFDPLHYVPEEGRDALGIGLVLSMADEAAYTYSLNMNNLTIRLGKGNADK